MRTAELGSIHAAAAKIGISEPAISAAIRSVELQLGHHIFVRTAARALAPTPSGRQFINCAKRLLDEVVVFERAAANLGLPEGGDIHVGCYNVPAPYTAAKVLQRLAQDHPGINVELHENDLAGVVTDLKAGVTDIALTYDAYPDNAIVFETLFEANTHVILSSEDDLAKQAAVSLRQLTSKPLILLDLPGAINSREFLSLFDRYELKPLIGHKVKNFEMVRSLVGIGLGYSFGRLPIRTEYSYNGSQVVRRRIVEELPTFRMCLAYPKDSMFTRAVNAFAEASRQSLKPLGLVRAVA